MQISQGKRCHVGLCLTAALISAVLMTGAAGSEGVGGMRIVPHYHSSVQSLTAEQATLLKDVLLEPTLSWFGGVLKVQRELSPLVFERSCSETHRYVDRRRYCVGTCSNSTLCGPTPIPEQHLQPCRSCQRTNCSEAGSNQPWQVGVPAADLVVYVSVVSDSYKCRAGCQVTSGYQQSVYSGHCQQEKRLDRPTGAYLAVCPTFLTTSPDFYHLQIASIVRHLVRILAFSESLFPFFRDEGGAPRNERGREGFPLRSPDGRYASDGVVRYYHHATWEVATTNETLIQPHFVKMIVTPNVVREVQSHFGCSEMIGGELESQTVLRSAAGDSFWEKRVFGEEVMTASASYYPVLSRLTLALLHDSGWYEPDYSYGASLHWGRGQGCGFIDGSCYKWVWPTETKGESPDTNVVPFCRHQQESAESCVNGRRAVGVCSIRNYPARLPRPFRYFSTRRRGGSSPMVDYCPIFLYDFASSKPTGRSCLTPPSTLPTLPVPEVYGPESQCFEHQWEGGAGEGGASCHTFSCTRDSVLVDIGGSKVNCSRGKAGEQVAVDNSTGNYTVHSVHIVCPSYQVLCENYHCPRLCSGHGNCIEGHCRCQPGYYGNDCSYSYLDRLLTCDSVFCQNGGSCTNSGGDDSGIGGGVSSGNDSGIGGGVSSGNDSGIGGGVSSGDDSGIGGGVSSGNDSGIGGGVSSGDDSGIGGGMSSGDDSGIGGGVSSGDDSGIGGGVSSGGGGLGFSCQCAAGYTGTMCENRVTADPCRDLSCPANTHCIRSDLGTEGQCECMADYGGEHCETFLLCEWRGRPCRNGRCRRGRDGEPECVCDKGFRGPQCDLTKRPDDPCLSSPCLNGGTCSTTREEGRRNLSYECSCLPGFKGRHCSHKKNPCLNPNPCHNGGECRQTMRGDPTFWFLFTCQ